MNNILIDSDIILDFLLEREPFFSNSVAILNLCEKKIIKGFITPVIISNVYYLLRKTSKHEKVVTKLKILLEILEVAIIDKDVILQALNSKFKDFGDALQNFSAEATKNIRVIVTRNTKDYKSSNLSVMLPELYLKMIKY